MQKGYGDNFCTVPSSALSGPRRLMMRVPAGACWLLVCLLAAWRAQLPSAICIAAWVYPERVQFAPLRLATQHSKLKLRTVLPRVVLRGGEPAVKGIVDEQELNDIDAKRGEGASDEGGMDSEELEELINRPLNPQAVEELMRSSATLAGNHSGQWDVKTPMFRAAEAEARRLGLNTDELLDDSHADKYLQVPIRALIEP